MSKVYEVVDNGSNHNLPDKEFNDVYKQDKPYTGKAPTRATFTQSAMTLLKGYVGSGIMALPYSFQSGGWLFSSFIFGISVGLLLLSVKFLLDVANAENKEAQGLTDYAQITYGDRGQTITKVTLIFYQIGKSIAYLIFFMQFFAHVLSDVKDQQGAGDYVYLILAFCIVIPLGFIDNMALFAKLSIFANGLTMIGLLYIILYDCVQILQNETLKENITNLAHFERFPMVIGVTVYGLGVIPIAFAIRSTMETQSEFARLFKIVSIFNVAIYLVFTNLCVWGLGDRIKQIALFSIGDSPSALVVQILYAIGLILSYPLQLLPAFQQIEGYESLKQYINPEIKYSRFRRFAIRCIINVAMGFVAYGIPQFAYFINILGAIGGASLNFLLPVLVNKKYFEKVKREPKILWQLNGILVFGVVGGLCSFIYSVVKLIG